MPDSLPENTASSTEKRPGYIIDVCLTCFRQAKWPFCAHRDNGPGWCMPLPVKLTDAGWRDLQKARRDA